MIRLKQHQKWGSRGKIPYLYYQGLMASASRICQTVLGLIGLPSTRLACAAMSAVESRLRGRAAWWTASHAAALTQAWSRGGKPDLPSAAGRSFQAKLPTGPASPPITHSVGMEVHFCGCLDIGQEGVSMQEQHQRGTLSQLLRDCPLPHDTLGLAPRNRRESQDDRLERDLA